MQPYKDGNSSHRHAPPGSQEWRDWIIAKPESVQEPYSTDPTMLTYRSSSSMTLGFVVRTFANSGRMYEIVEPAARTGARATETDPTFVRRVLPAVPAR
ncbi:hypothetical protein ACWD69_17670 [Micromonospora chokoriensis]